MSSAVDSKSTSLHVARPALIAAITRLEQPPPGRRLISLFAALELATEETNRAKKSYDQSRMTLRITEIELARDINGVLAKVQAGVEVIIEKDRRPVAVIKLPQHPGRMISECIALAKAYEERLGYSPVPDPDFVTDLQAAIDAHREP